MPNDFGNQYIKCPYFKYTRDKDIVCEGITNDCITISRFRPHNKRNLHCKIFCAANYKNCEIRRMLEEKYDD
jgi:hypothetical protein